jgi:adenylate cyclase
MEQEQPVRVGRRLAAIVAADVAGYSRLMGLDEVGTARTLREHRKVTDALVAKHGGRLVKTTGDGLLLEFTSVVDAVECAVAMQEVMAERNQGVPEDRRMLLRIGINLGDILIEGDDILGDGVNVAARLEGIADPGGICISSSAYEQVRGKVAVEFADLGEQRLKNIERPVRIYATKSSGHIEKAVVLSQPEALKPFPLPEKPSIAVLPFQNMSGDPEQEYFSDGIVEDIITALSRFKSVFVIARNSSFTYKGKAVDIRQVGRELGVRYVLEGSVRKAGARLRITAQLIEAETGTHLWADRFDGALEDVFDLQDRITAAIVGTIEPNLRRAEIERAGRKRPESLDAYDLYLRALPHLASAMPEDAAIGMGLLEQALKIDPNYAAAHAHLAWALEMRFYRGGFDEADAAASVRHARAAVAHGGDDATALAVAALPLLQLGHDFEAASGAIARAIALNGSSATALYFGAHIHAYSGDAALAEDYALRALRLSPYDELAFEGHCAPGLVRIRERRCDDAAAHLAKAVQANPRFSVLHVEHAAALALAGRLEEAKPSRNMSWSWSRITALALGRTSRASLCCPNSGARSWTACAWRACRSRRPDSATPRYV